jgi:hypothetical protein
MKLPPKSSGFPHSAILHAIVSLPLYCLFLVVSVLTFYGSVPRRLAGSPRK